MDFDQFAAEQTRLLGLLRNKRTFAEGRALCGSQNAQLHRSASGGPPTIGDRVAEGLTPGALVFRPEGEFETIGWALWHITRIEDAVGNLLIAGTGQVFNPDWRRRIGSTITDTANAFTAADVDRWGAGLRLEELLAYRDAVGQRTQEVIAGVTWEDSRQKPAPAALERIMAEGVLTAERESFWLKDFWGEKTLAGLLLLPLTRHQPMHLPNCFRLKERAGA